jgi:hypothetical protein
VPNHILLYAGGSIFGGLSTLAFLAVAWRRRTPYMVPLVSACTAGLGETALHMLTVKVAHGLTDYTALVGLGVPAGLIMCMGAALLLVSVMARILFLPLLGVPYELSTPARLVVFEIGILPYVAASHVYGAVTRHVTLAAAAGGVLMAALFLGVEAVLSKALPKRFALFRRIEPVAVGIRHLNAAWIGAVVVIALMLLVSTQGE